MNDGTDDTSSLDNDEDGGFEMIDLTQGKKRFALLVQPHGAQVQSFFEVRADDVEDVLDAVASAMADEEPIITKRDPENEAILVVGLPRNAAVQIVSWEKWEAQLQASQKAQRDAVAAQQFGISAPSKIARRGS